MPVALGVRGVGLKWDSGAIGKGCYRCTMGGVFWLIVPALGSPVGLGTGRLVGAHRLSRSVPAATGMLEC